MKIGGSFAPPLSDSKLAEYKVAIDQIDPKSQLGDALQILYKAVKLWWELPESNEPTTIHPTGRATVRPLSQENMDALWEAIPWPSDLAQISNILETIQDVSLRNIAFHLLWFVTELCLDREPITSDGLK